MGRPKVSPRVLPQGDFYNYDSAKDVNRFGVLLQQLRKSRKLALEDVSVLLKAYGVDIGKAGLSKWENGQTVPGAYQFMALCEIFELEDPVSYFTSRAPLNDEGLQKLASYKQDLIDSGNYAPAPSLCEIVRIEMPVHLLAASAGTGNFLDGDNFRMVSVPQEDVPSGADFGIYIAGDSMEPFYSDGDLVWIRKCDRLSPGEVGIFTYDGDGYIKMYSERIPEDLDAFTDSQGVLHPQPVLISYNKRYSPIVVSQDKSFQVVGRVL